MTISRVENVILSTFAIRVGDFKNALVWSVFHLTQNNFEYTTADLCFECKFNHLRKKYICDSLIDSWLQ